MTEKARLRKEFAAKRKAAFSEYKNKKIYGNLTGLEEFRRAETLLSYVSVRSEADSQRIIEKALDMGKRVAVPKTEKGGLMVFHYIESLYDLTEEVRGIPEPSSACEKFDIERTGKCICIVPGLAFDKKGYRLGYGGGYYDRFMEKYHDRMIFCGICFDDIITESLPYEEHDRAVDLIVTDNLIMRNS